ncbi:hypothetical protein [Caproiciproducens galactitolivorans]|uniref:hypothetical protein n=1 Tax=Caproiciproducens galactitolivorans TaxID=642589 RepID=UPI002409589B|nr:hypothetical protein [Caproiciproducens galactitolivorans]
MGSVKLPMLSEASAGRAAAQFIVRSEGIGGLPPTSNFPVFAQAKNWEMGLVGPTRHCLLLLYGILDTSGYLNKKVIPTGIKEPLNQMAFC